MESICLIEKKKELKKIEMVTSSMRLSSIKRPIGIGENQLIMRG